MFFLQPPIRVLSQQQVFDNCFVTLSDADRRVALIANREAKETLLAFK